MLSHPTIDRLRELGLIGMVHALEEQRRQSDSNQLSFDDPVGDAGGPRGAGA